MYYVYLSAHPKILTEENVLGRRMFNPCLISHFIEICRLLGDKVSNTGHAVKIELTTKFNQIRSLTLTDAERSVVIYFVVRVYRAQNNSEDWTEGIRLSRNSLTYFKRIFLFFCLFCLHNSNTFPDFFTSLSLSLPLPPSTLSSPSLYLNLILSLSLFLSPFISLYISLSLSTLPFL